MRNYLVPAALAAALAASGALAQPEGKGNAGGNPGKGGGSAQVDHSMHGNSGGGGKKADTPARQQQPKAVQRQLPERGPDRSVADRGNGGGNAKAQPAARADNLVRGNGNAGNGAQSASAIRGGNDARSFITMRDDNRPRLLRLTDDRGLIDGCPPGLAAKNNGCLPPGQAMKADAYERPVWWGLSNNYRYSDGYMLRYEGSRVTGYVPLLGGALALGNMWPSSYGPAPLPTYYDNYYGLGGPDRYRYYDGAIYRLDPQNSAIESIAALLTGDDFVVGQRAPTGYSVYNVPYDYRDSYVDSADSNYRYSDGYVYQIDPTTQLVQAAIELLS